MFIRLNMCNRPHWIYKLISVIFHSLHNTIVTLYLKNHLSYACMCVRVVYMCMHVGTCLSHVWTSEGNLSEMFLYVSFLLPHCFYGLNSCFQSSWQALLTAEPSCCPIDLQLNLCAIEDFFEITKLGMVTGALDPTNQLFQSTKKTRCEFYRLGVY